MESSRNSSAMSVTLRHLNPQVSVSLHIGATQGGNVNISSPASEQVNYLDPMALLWGADIFDMLGEAVNIFEILGNVDAILNELQRKGFGNIADLIFGGW
jgi:hypothetical protein